MRYINLLLTLTMTTNTDKIMYSHDKCLKQVTTMMLHGLTHSPQSTHRVKSWKSHHFVKCRSSVWVRRGKKRQRSAILHEPCNMVGCSSPFPRLWVHRWINHWSLWCMASATSELRLPSQLQGVTTLWPVPDYTDWWEAHVCEQLAHGCYMKAEQPRFEPATFWVTSAML